MSNKRDYTQYQGQRTNTTPVDEKANVEVDVAPEEVDATPVVENEAVVETTKETDCEPVEEADETKETDCESVEEAVETECKNDEVDTVTGIVTDCKMLNIRKTPSKDSDPVCTVDAGEFLTVNLNDSTATWYSVRTSSGVEGFCMKEFVSVN